MRSRLPWLGLTAAALLVAGLPRGATAATPDDFFFKEGDKVVVLGDSITEQRLYSTYVEVWTVTRFPGWKMTFRNVGIGGDTSPGGNGRFQRDVAAYHPTALTVDFGMNDGGYGGFVPDRYNTYMTGLRGIAKQATAARIRVAWITPQPLDTDQQGKTALTAYNQTLEKFSAGVEETAQKNDGVFVDQFHPYLAVLDKARGSLEKYPRITAGDAVHPGPPGQALMAASILKGLHFPELVSSVEIDATDGKVVNEKRCKVMDVEAKDGRVRFRRHDEALPYFPAAAAGILKWAPLRDELNDYRLKVTGLKGGRYAVLLGGKKVAEYESDDLAKGVNLAGPALSTGPVADQVKAVEKAVVAKTDYFHDKIFRGVVLAPLNIPEYLAPEITPQKAEAKRREVLQERLAKMPELDEAIQKALVIEPHTVEIVAAEK
jgi:lysophospholipase L1-like esterase